MLLTTWLRLRNPTPLERPRRVTSTFFEKLSKCLLTDPRLTSFSCLLFREVAKGNTDASLGDRASAAFSAVGDKADESKADSKASAYKTSAQRPLLLSLSLSVLVQR